MSKKVLIVDDSIYMRSLIRSALEEAGLEVVGEAKDGETAIDLALDTQPDLITLDNILPDMMGFEILKVLRDQGLESKVIMISAVGQQTVVNKGKELGASEYIVKPFTSEALIEVVNRVM
ncbi:MAG: response regulator [Flammeovirgaceae bacterium]|uniref:response regulator n=1 Tax=Marinoscillum TaxID=643701 RepID=UPI000C0A0228|nr:response regulator [Marinoscillum pacificum]MAE84941.1 response regulator [Flammeovirgaceae bacterium]MBE63517.1 response regulator [Flammeovirgaceae bacterium]MBR08500.1 response regulator [Rickettsiales bacterium]HCX21952.1 response regulator [Cytophagales bacterium]|tara:strand:- start:172 stop:531 length:360 start_codon:yes stop_codon:yes gene_type:complete